MAVLRSSIHDESHVLNATLPRPLQLLIDLGTWLITVAITLVGLAALTFFIGRVLPIDPVLSIVGEKATPEVYQRVYLELGLDKAISARSFEPKCIDVYPYRATQPVVSLELGAVMRERYGVPYSVIHRADLADILYRACRRFANIDLLFGIRNFDAVNHARLPLKRSGVRTGAPRAT